MKTLKIKDICDKGSSALRQKDVEGKEGKYPVFGASGYISSIDTYHQDKDYIAIVKDGSGIGRVTFMPAYSSVIGTMQYILPKEGYNIKYISYCLQSLDLAKYKQGAAIPHIYFRDYGERYVNIEESFPEQERIVSLLDAEFAKIDAIKANAEKQLQDAKALFQSALKYYLTPKEGWVEKTLKEIGKTQTGCTPSMSKKEFYNEEYMPFIKPSEINFDGLGGINYKTQMLSKLGAENGRIFQPNSIFMVCIGATISKLGISEREISCNQQINVLTPKDLYHSKFIYYAMLNPTFINLVKKEGTSAQATLPIISKGKWEQLKIKVPQYTDQLQIAEQLDKLSAKIQSLQSNFDTTVTLCNDLKQSILKDIFG